MADIQSPQSAAGRSASEFLRWWKQHLWECVPASMRRRIVQSRRPAIWSPSEDRVWVAGTSLDASKSFTQSALAQRGGEVALVVGENNGFRRTVDLPMSVEGRLQQVLGFELDRLTPLRPSELYYDFHVVERNNSAGTCRVELVAAPKTRVAPLMDAAAKRNITVSRLLLSSADADTPLDLLSPSRAQAGEVATNRNWINWALAGLCAALALALVIFPLWQMRQQVIDLQPIEAKAKIDAEAASILQRQLEKQIGEYNLPLSRKHASPLAIQVLEELSKRLPDDTWVQTLEIHAVPNQKTAREVVLQGETGSGGKIMQILQESALLKDPTFKSTMTRVSPSAERFHIAAELVAAQMPKAMLLSDASGVVTVSPSPVAGAPVAAAPKIAAPSQPQAPTVTAPASTASVAPTASPATDPKRPVATPGASPASAPPMPVAPSTAPTNDPRKAPLQQGGGIQSAPMPAPTLAAPPTEKKP
ncbi:MAG: PilN domain-containing protein [Casimicrobium sp.]